MVQPGGLTLAFASHVVMSMFWQASAMQVDDFGRDLAGIQALQRKQEVTEKDMTALFQQIQVLLCLCIVVMVICLFPSNRLGWRHYVFLGCLSLCMGGSLAERLACWTHAQKGLGSNCSCDAAVLGKLFTPIVPLFTEQRNW